MTDKELYISMLKSFGLTEVKNDVSLLEYLKLNEFMVVGDHVYLGSGTGYDGYFSWLQFNEIGKYIGHGSAG